MEQFRGEVLNLNNERSYFLKKMLVIAIPVVFQNLISVGVNLVDTLMIGKLGEAELAAVGSANQVYMIYASICFGLYSGAAVYVAQFFGIRDIKTIKKVIGIDYVIGILSSIVMVGIVLKFAPFLISLFAEYDEVIEYGAEYIRIACFSYIFMGISFAISFNCRSIQRLIVPTVVSVITLLTNIILNYVLIFGHLGFEPMGLRGAAIATLVARMIEFTVLITYIYSRKDHPFNAKPKELFSFGRRLFKDVMNMAFPVVLTEVGWSVSVALTFMAYGRISYEALAVVQVSEVVSNLFQCMFFGLGNATAVIIGESLGRCERERAFYHAKIALALTWLINILMTGALFFAKEEIAAIYKFDEETTELLIKTLAVWAFTIIPKMLTYIMVCGILRAGGDTLFAMAVDLSFNLFAQAPLAFFGVYVLEWPLYMIVGLVAMGEVMKTILCYFRFYTKKWINVVTGVKY